MNCFASATEKTDGGALGLGYIRYVLTQVAYVPLCVIDLAERSITCPISLDHVDAIRE